MQDLCKSCCHALVSNTCKNIYCELSLITTDERIKYLKEIIDKINKELMKSRHQQSDVLMKLLTVMNQIQEIVSNLYYCSYREQDVLDWAVNF
jgi:hypothetical protein